MSTNNDLVAFVKTKVGTGYWYGTYGQRASEQLFEAKAKQYPSQYKADKSTYTKDYGKPVTDCIGLVKWFLWGDPPTYCSNEDLSATGYYNKATKKGTIDTFDKAPGRLVFKGGDKTKSHVGVYIGDDKVVEAKGHSYGTVTTTFTGGGWKYWAQCHLIEECGAPAPIPEPAPAPTKSVDELAQEVLAGKWGNGDARKAALQAAGYDYNAVQARVNEILKASKPTPKPAPTAKNKYKVTSKSGLNVRYGPGTNYSKVSRTGLSYGEVISVDSVLAGWGHTTGRLSGWVKMSYLSRV